MKWAVAGFTKLINNEKKENIAKRFIIEYCSTQKQSTVLCDHLDFTHCYKLASRSLLWLPLWLRLKWLMAVKKNKMQ